jgi:hypothetical protein
VQKSSRLVVVDEARLRLLNLMQLRLMRRGSKVMLD